MKKIVLPAEWHPQDAIQFTFPHRNTDWITNYEAAVECFVNCIETVSRFQRAIVVCADQVEVEQYLSHLPQAQLILVEIPSNDTWVRDHGGITILENGKPVILDFQFNAWGLKFAADQDNLITKRLHEKETFNTGLRTIGLVLEGGSIESDGKGTLLTTSACLLSPNRNPYLSQAEIENQLKSLFGLERVLWLHHGHLEGDDTDAHIDTLARFCDEKTIAYVQCKNEADSHYAALKAMEKELQQFKTLQGEPYQLIPLPMTDPIHDSNGQRLPATYANFLIINDAVLVPTYGIRQDEVALQILKDVFKDRKIIGINCRALIEQHGSLHCISMQYPKGVLSE
ncbi:MAG: agmatine deiminase family protein [Bacteroidota bacterium]